MSVPAIEEGNNYTSFLVYSIMGSLDTPRIDLHNVSYTDPYFASSDTHDIRECRKLVPVAASGTCTYLNAAFQPPMNSRVKDACTDFLNQASTWQNPKSGWQSEAEEAQQLLAKYLHVASEDLVFTRDTTEGLNLFQRSIDFKPGDNVVLLETEHPNHAYGWLALRDRGLEVKFILNGNVPHADDATFAPYVDDRTIAIGFSSIMFHNGQMNNVKSICSKFRPRGIYVLVDMTQHVGTSPINLPELGVSAAAFGCHKALGCLTGIGALYIEPQTLRTLKPTPPIVGAGAVANVPSTLLVDPTLVEYHASAKRYAHLNLSLIGAVSLKASLKLLDQEIGMDRVERHLRMLGAHLGHMCEEIGIEVVGSQISGLRSPHIYVLKLLREEWSQHFEEEKVIVSQYRCGVRVSLGFYNDLGDIGALGASIKRGLAKGLMIG